MSEKKKEFSFPPNSLSNPLEFIQNFDRSVRQSDEIFKKIDDNLKGFDSSLELVEETRRSPRKAEESRASCLRCAFEHLGDSEQQLREASSASPGSERLRNKLENAMDGLYQAERRHLGPKYPEIAAKTRSLRKTVDKSIFGGREVSLDQVITEIKDLRSEVRERYKELYPSFECDWCSDLAEDISSRFDSDEDRIKVMTAIYTLAEKGSKGELADEEKAKATKVLMDYGVYKEVMGKATEMLREAKK